MPFSHSIEDRIIHIRWSGTLTKDDLQAAGREIPRLVAQLGFVPHLLHNLNAVEQLAFPPLAAYEHSVQRKRVSIPAPLKSATVAQTPAIAAMAQVFRAMNRTPNLEMEVFSTEAEARAWLGEP